MPTRRKSPPLSHHMIGLLSFQMRTWETNTLSLPEIGLMPYKQTQKHTLLISLITTLWPLTKKRQKLDIIPLKPKLKHHIPWESEEIANKRANLKEKADIKNSNPSTESIKVFKAAFAEFTNTYTWESTAIYIQSKIQLINNAAANKQSSLAWKTVNEISGIRSTNKSKLKANSQTERLNKWKEHFENLLGKAPNVSDNEIETIIDQPLNIKLGNFTEAELVEVLKKTKNKKAAGLENVPPEVWKTQAFNDILLDLCNDTYNHEEIEKWTEGCILPLPKKEIWVSRKNYRGITLTSIAAKIYNSLLFNRIQPEVEKILRRNQNGFRKNRSTVSQILTVRRIIEGVKAKNMQAALLFVDFSKAFDSVHRGKMEKILLANRDSRCHNDALPKHKIFGQIPRWRHELLWYTGRCSTGWHPGAVSFRHHPWLCFENIPW